MCQPLLLPRAGGPPAALLIRPYASPCGPLLLGAAGGRLVLSDWSASPRHAANLRRLGRHPLPAATEADAAVLRAAAEQLDAYFAGRLRAFRLPLLLAGTPFQRAVWETLAAIPYAATTTYASLARTLGRPAATRAVAAAVGSNPIVPMLPCHRVIGSDGSLTGYAGGLAAKTFLLALERRHATAQPETR